MTYYDYTLMCIGQKDAELDEMRKHRSLLWTVYAGYRDPKKGAKTITDFMPLDGDNIIKVEPPSPERLIELDNSFKSMFGKNGKSAVIS